MHIAIETCEISHKVTFKLRNKSLSLFGFRKGLIFNSINLADLVDLN
jgi:hypothetical protein